MGQTMGAHLKIVNNEYFQVCWVVNDIDAAMEKWQRSASIGPFYIFRHPDIQDFRYRGNPGKLDMSVAIAQAGNVQIELIQQHDDRPSAYRDVYAPGQEGMHHICGFAADYDAELERYRLQGLSIAHSGLAGDMRFCYVDTRSRMGCMTELLEERKFMRDMFRLIADAARDWDGTNPVRTLDVVAPT
jgi:hypothetical protein